MSLTDSEASTPVLILIISSSSALLPDTFANNLLANKIILGSITVATMKQGTTGMVILTEMETQVIACLMMQNLRVT